MTDQERVRQARAELARRELARRQAAKVSQNATNSTADMSFMGRLKDNVIGVDDGVQSVGEKVAAALNMGGESLTMGVVGDETAAALDSVLGRGPYEERRDLYRREEAQFEEENPGLALAADIAPAFVPGLGAAKAVGAATSVGGAALRGAGIGAGAGAVHSFAEAEGGTEERIDAGFKGLGVGLLFGGAASGTLSAATKVPAVVRRVMGKAERRPTTENLENARSVAYRAVDQAGEVFSGDETTALYETVKGIFEDSNYVADVDNASRATLKILERNAGKELTLGKLDKVRRGLWARYNSASDQPHILEAIHAVDDLIDSRAGASELMDAARGAHRRYSKAKLLDKLVTKAEDQTASSGSGGNILNAYRRAVTSVINDPRKARFFDQSEIDLMRAFVRGDLADNTLRKIGKLSPDGNGLMMALHVTGGVLSHGATIPLMAVGGVSKIRADKRAMAKVEAIRDSIAGFKLPEPNPVLIAPAATATAPLSSEATNGSRRRLQSRQ